MLSIKTNANIAERNATAKDTKNMFDAFRKEFEPNKVILFKSTNGESIEITRLAEFTQYLSHIDDKATAYICNDHRCLLPMTDVKKALKVFDYTS